MVCLGNICRSPMAEAVSRALVDQAGLGHRVTVESFGTAGYHIGESADPQAAAALRRRGWSADGHRARQIDSDNIAVTDLVLCADRPVLAAVRHLAGTEEHRSKVVLLRSFDPFGTPSDEEVPDPWGHAAAAFDRSLHLIERACRGLVAGLADPPR